MGNKTCIPATCISQGPSQPYTSNMFRSIQQIESEIIEYSKKHRLMFYPTTERTVIQTLYSLRQHHICDRIVQLSQKERSVDIRGYHKEKENIKNRQKKGKQNEEIISLPNYQEQKKNLLSDVMKVDLQKIDQLFFSNAQIMKFNKWDHDIETRNTEEDSGKTKFQAQINQNTIKNDKKPNSMPKVQQTKLKYEQKMASQHYEQYTKLGEKAIRDSQVIILACIQCFNGIGCLTTPTSLPSSKTTFELFLDKLQALKHLHSTPLSTILLVNPSYLETTLEITSTIYPFLTSLHIIKYESPLPSFDSDGKLLLSQESRLKFSHLEGDLIGFIEKSIHVAQLLEKFDILHWVDVNNLLEKVGDGFMVGAVKKAKQTGKDIFAGKIVALQQRELQTTANAHSGGQNKEKVVFLRSGFIEFQQEEQFANLSHSRPKGQQDSKYASSISQVSQHAQSKSHSRNFKSRLQNSKYLTLKSQDHKSAKKLTMLQSFILSTSLLINRNSNLDRHLLTRVYIKPQYSTEQSKQQIPSFTFQRSIPDILSQSFTRLFYVQRELQCAKVNPIQNPLINKNRQLGQYSPAVVYSNYCKQFLGIKNSKHTELVQVCPQILFGSKDRQKKIRETFREYKKVGFPLVIKKNQTIQQDLSEQSL